MSGPILMQSENGPGSLRPWELADEIIELRAENAALRADKDRLDWLENHAIPWRWLSPEKIDDLGPIVVSWKSNLTLRQVIDAVREEAQP